MGFLAGWGRGGETIGRQDALSVVWRLGRLALVSYVVAIGTWTALAPASATAEVAVGDRASPAARAAVRVEPTAPVTITVDGLAASVRASGTVGAALGDLGLSAGTADRLSAPADASLRPGQRIAVERGFAVTLVDGGQVVAIQAARGTVAELLAAARVSLGNLDQIDRALGAKLAAGDVVRVTRIAETEVTVVEDMPFPVRYVADASLDRGRQVVVTAGVPGRAANTYLVRVVDGLETQRNLVASVELAPAAEEVRRIGTRTPPASSEIETIIREAADRQGANPDQLLRVAWCESRFNPSAYNASGASGLFQFMPRTWAANSVRAGYAGASPFDPVAAANVAAWMFARGSANLWTCR